MSMRNETFYYRSMENVPLTNGSLQNLRKITFTNGKYLPIMPNEHTRMHFKRFNLLYLKKPCQRRILIFRNLISTLMNERKNLEHVFLYRIKGYYYEEFKRIKHQIESFLDFSYPFTFTFIFTLEEQFSGSWILEHSGNNDYYYWQNFLTYRNNPMEMV